MTYNVYGGTLNLAQQPSLTFNVFTFMHVYVDPYLVAM